MNFNTCLCTMLFIYNFHFARIKKCALYHSYNVKYFQKYLVIAIGRVRTYALIEE